MDARKIYKAERGHCRLNEAADTKQTEGIYKMGFIVTDWSKRITTATMLNGLCQTVKFKGKCQGVCQLPWPKVALDPVANQMSVND